MRKFANFELKEIDGKFSLKIDGADLSDCTKSVEFHHEAGDIPTLKVEVYASGCSGTALGHALGGETYE
mgnify:CR=1 FL=1